MFPKGAKKMIDTTKNMTKQIFFDESQKFMHSMSTSILTLSENFLFTERIPNVAVTLNNKTIALYNLFKDIELDFFNSALKDLILTSLIDQLGESVEIYEGIVERVELQRTSRLKQDELSDLLFDIEWGLNCYRDIDDEIFAFDVEEHLVIILEKLFKKRKMYPEDLIQRFNEEQKILGYRMQLFLEYDGKPSMSHKMM